VGPRRREWGVVVCRHHCSCGTFVECGGGRMSLLMGGGDEPSSPLVGSGDGSAVVVGLGLLRCPSPFSPSFRRIVIVSVRRSSLQD
jgi:hypothetical protein